MNQDLNKQQEEKNKKTNIQKRYKDLISKWGNLPDHNTIILKLLPVFLILAAIPLTVFFAQKQQSGNTHADTSFIPFSITIAPSASNITKSGATVTWYLSDYGTGQVQYGTSLSYGLSPGPETSFNWNYHKQTLSNLLPNTTYHFRVISLNKSGYTVISPDYTFTTSNPITNTPTPTIANVSSPTPTPNPTPNPSNTNSGLYGPGIGYDGLANTTVQGSQPNYYRFRAGQSSGLASALVYIIANGNTGYSNGTGGSYRITLQTCNAANFPSGTVLGTANTLTTGNPAAHPMWTITFPNPPALTADTLYCMVWTDIDSNPNTNYVSLDGIYNPHSNPYQPKYPNTDWGWGYENGSTWTERTEQVATLDLGYTNGTHEGVGYMEVSYNGDQGTISGNSQVREVFKVSGSNRTIKNFGLYMSRESGNDPLVVSLEDGSGTVIDAVSVPASSFLQVTTPTGGGGESEWTTGSFATSHTLAVGSTYRLRLSTASSSNYQIWPIRSGVKEYGFSPSTVFSDMVSCDKGSGSSWSPLGRVAGENDLPFYLK